MPKLLVSVRNAHEAKIVLAEGVDLIDVKEPRGGSLGAATLDVIAEVIRLAVGQRPVSVALGELAACGAARSADVAERFRNRPPAFVKIGLAQCATNSRWRRDLEVAYAHLPDQTGRVAVAYADFENAQSPEPDEVLEVGKAHFCQAALLDTFDKRGPGIAKLWTPLKIARWIAAARETGMQAVVAGQLSITDCKAVAEYDPDYIGVRGAACWPNRCGQIDSRRIAQLRIAVSGEGDTLSRPRRRGDLKTSTLIDGSNHVDRNA
jgi:(5-formylfuran-3-yl)methyl phosphate synthase